MRCEEKEVNCTLKPRHLSRSAVGPAWPTKDTTEKGKVKEGKLLGATIRFTCFRRAGNRAVRTKYAAVAGERTEQSFAGFAFVEKDARIRWHFFLFRDAAIRTCDRRYVSCPGHLGFLRMYKIHSEKGFGAIEPSSHRRSQISSKTSKR